jgi:hypothetical protein
MVEGPEAGGLIMAWKEYEAVGDSTLYGGPREGVVKSVLSRIAYLIRDQRATPTCPIGWSNPGEEYLSGWTGFGIRAVRSAIARLVADEIIYVNTYRAANGWRKNRYALNMEKIEAARRPDVTDESEDEPQAVSASGHRRSRTELQALKTEATGAERLLAVELSSGVAVRSKPLEQGPTNNTRSLRSRDQDQDQNQHQTITTPWDDDEQSAPVNPTPKPRGLAPNPTGTSRPGTPGRDIPVSSPTARPPVPRPPKQFCQRIGCGGPLQGNKPDGECLKCGFVPLKNAPPPNKLRNEYGKEVDGLPHHFLSLKREEICQNPGCDITRFESLYDRSSEYCYGEQGKGAVV